MSTPTPEQQRKAIAAELVAELVKKFVDQGRLVEAGFVMFRTMVIPEDASEVQVKEMRMAFMAGAQHVFASMIGMMDPGMEPTENDMRRMSSVSKELETWVAEMKVRTQPQG